MPSCDREALALRSGRTSSLPRWPRAAGQLSALIDCRIAARNAARCRHALLARGASLNPRCQLSTIIWMRSRRMAHAFPAYLTICPDPDGKNLGRCRPSHRQAIELGLQAAMQFFAARGSGYLFSANWWCADSSSDTRDAAIDSFDLLGVGRPESQVLDPPLQSGRCIAPVTSAPSARGHRASRG